MNENPGQNEPAVLEAGGASERRLEAEPPPSGDETTEDGQEVSRGIAQFINEGGNGGVTAPSAIYLRGAVAGISISDLEWANSR